MKNLYVPFSLLVSFFFMNSAVSQSDIAIGQWKEHLPFNNAIYVTQSDEKIFYATHYAVLEVDKAEHSVRRMTKVEGLSNVGVSLVKYNEAAKTLVVVYDDSDIDLVTEEGV